MAKLPIALFQNAHASRQMLLIFTLVSAIINGLVTASVGAWLAQKYAAAQSRRASINGLSTLLYERRIKAGLVVSSLRRNSEPDELRHRKRGYDEAFVDWNKNIRQNLFAIREVMGENEFSSLEQDFEKYIVDPFSRIDSCLTRAYDQKMTSQDPLPSIRILPYGRPLSTNTQLRRILHQRTLQTYARPLPALLRHHRN